MTIPSLSFPFPSRPWLTRRNRFERAWSSRHTLEGLLTILLLSLALLSAVWLTSQKLIPWILPLLGLVAALFLIAAGLWLALPAWFHPSFRWLAWRASLLLWRLRSLSRMLPAVGVVLIALTVLGGWWLYSLEGSGGAKEVTISLISVLLLWSILFMLVQARKRLFVADFNDYAKVGEEGCGKAIAARLRNELNSIAALYRDIDEALPSRGGKTTGLSVSVQDTGAEFQEVLGSSFTVSAFGFQLPFGALVSLLGGRSWGPRLTGSLHKEEDCLVLIAEISGGRKEGSWRVSTDDLDEEDRQRPGMQVIYKLVEQMAYRVLTSQLDIGSPRWEAVRSFTEGLRAYRRVRRTEKDKTIYLRKAEREFIRARNEDNRFVQCHYDLGVVYEQLGQYESAEAAFRQTIEEDPERFEPYLGLATVYLGRTGFPPQFRNVQIFADKALRILPRKPSAWNLRGFAIVSEKGDSKSEEIWSKILESFGMAAGLAWRSLCREILRGDPDSPEAHAQMRLAQICTGNLAEAVAHRARCMRLGEGECRRSAGLFRHALCLQPRNPDLHFGLGQTLFQAQDWEGAREAFFEAFGDGLEPRLRALRWAYLTAIHAHLNNSDGVQSAYRNFLDFAVAQEETVLTAEGLRELLQDSSYVDGFEKLSKDLDRIGSIPKDNGAKDYLKAMKRVAAFLQRLEAGEPDEESLRKECKLLDKSDREWARAQVSIRLARKYLEHNPLEAYSLLNKAKLRLEKEQHARQVEKQGLQTLMARALLLQAKRSAENELLIPALACAEESSQQEPASAVRRWVLSEVYSALKDFEQVSQESGTSLALGSAVHLLKDPQALTYLAEKWLQQVSELHSSDLWKQELARGRAFLNHIREIIESQPFRTEQIVCHALLHHWLGRFSCELRECDAGISQMEIAIQMGARPVESLLILGRAYAETGAFAKAEQAYSSAFHRVCRPKPSAVELEPDLSKALKDDRPIDELQIEILLRLALLYASMGSNLQWADLLANWSRLKMRDAQLPKSRRREYQALYHEVRGRLRLQRGKTDESIAELERARKLWSSASNCYHLAKAYEAKARLGRDKASALRRAADLCDQADRLDLPQRYHERLDNLRKCLNGSPKPKEKRVQVPFSSAHLKEVEKGAEAN